MHRPFRPSTNKCLFEALLWLDGPITKQLTQGETLLLVCSAVVFFARFDEAQLTRLYILLVYHAATRAMVLFPRHMALQVLKRP
jgi:hypothetical protein